MTLPHSHQVSPATCRHSTCTRVKIYVNLCLQQTVFPTHSSNCSSNVLQTSLRFISGLNHYSLVPVSARSKVWVCGPSVARIVGSNLAGLWIPVFCECFVLSGRGPCVGLITRPEESYRVYVCVCVCVCVWASVIRCNNNSLHLQWVGRGGQTKKKRQRKKGRTQQSWLKIGKKF
jgi:hypothetical protein